mgnify:FL=1
MPSKDKLCDCCWWDDHWYTCEPWCISRREETEKEISIWQELEVSREIRMPFIDEELMIFSMVYHKLLRITKKENIFKWIELKPCKKWNVIF